jgi:hypothetical protein
MQDKNDFTQKESLEFIEQMIDAARKEHREKGEGWLIWGWLLFIASIISAVFMKTGLTENL